MRTVLRFAVLSFFLSPRLLVGGESADFPQGWSEIKPGGETSCSRGDEYSIFVYPGSVNKVVVDFIGGGACWSPETCAPESPTFTETVDSLRERIKKDGLHGLHDKTDRRNPTKDWFHLVVPYCTGDVHWGSHDQTYTRKNGSSFTVKHRGAINAKTALSWLSERVRDPEQVLVTGCSAGAYGSIYWTPHVRKMYPDTRMVQFADSGNNVIHEGFTERLEPLWKYTDNLPRWIPDINPDEVDVTKLTLDEWYKIALDYHPDLRFSQYSTALDGVQTFFYELMGGDPVNWAQRLQSSVRTLADSSSQYKYYVSPGDDHCILPFDSFYTQKVNGQPFLRWFSNYLEGNEVPNVMCTDCGTSQ